VRAESGVQRVTCGSRRAAFQVAPPARIFSAPLPVDTGRSIGSGDGRASTVTGKSPGGGIQNRCNRRARRRWLPLVTAAPGGRDLRVLAASSIVPRDAKSLRRSHFRADTI